MKQPFGIALIGIICVSQLHLGNFRDVQYGGLNGKYAKIEMFEGRCTGRNAPMTIYPVKVFSEKNYAILNATMHVKEDIDPYINMSIKTEKCTAKDNLDTCQHVNLMKYDKFCQLLKVKSDFWSPIISVYRPTLSCPIKKGNYIATNARIDTGAFILFPIENWYWRVYTELRSSINNRLLMCVLIETRIAYQKWDADSVTIPNATIELVH